MGGYGGYAKGLGGVPSPGGKADQGNDGNAWGGWGVGIPPGGGVNGSRGTSPYRRVHQEKVGYHSGKGGLLPHI